MGKMLKGVRPRRCGSKINESHKLNNSLPVFRISEKDFMINMPHFIDTSTEQYSRRNNKDGQRPKTKNLLDHFENYCGKTTLHGLRYVGDPSLSIGERIFWFFSFSVAIAFAAYYISNIYEKWITSPVIISFSPFDADLNSIPFPSVTICNMNQAKKTEAMKIKSEGNPLELKLLNDVCNGNEEYIETPPYNWSTLRNFLIRVGSSCSDMIKICEWSSQKKNCDELFNNDLTDEGLCCSFNRLPPSKIFRNPNDIALLNQTYPDNVYDWNPETGFTDDDNGDENVVPKRPLGAGSHLGLTVVMDAQIDEYYCSSTSSVGFKIILSNPIETPKMAAFGSLLSPGVEVRYSITPSVREASDNLRSVPLQKRQCYFANEKTLQYYRKYSKRNCELECLSSYIYSTCKCVPYYLPKNKSMKYCEQIDDNCVGNSNYKLYSEGIYRISCKCYNDCSSVTYSHHIAYSTVDERFAHHLIENFTGEYKSYTQRNCDLECQSNYTYELCSCIPFYLPRNKSTKACGKADQKCVNEAKENLEKTYGNGSSCNCSPGCFELVFNDAKSYGELSTQLNNSWININNISDSANDFSNYFVKNFAVAHFFFPNSKFTKQIKSELYGFTEILSNIGGLLGLCMGFSFLSLVEVIYFILIEVFSKLLKKFKAHRKRKFLNNPPSKYPFIK